MEIGDLHEVLPASAWADGDEHVAPAARNGDEHVAPAARNGARRVEV